MPGGRSFRQLTRVQGVSLAALFKRADSTPLPALGGMARPDGVVIASERYFAFANKDGSLLEGVHRRKACVTTQSIVMRASTGTIRRVSTEYHDLAHRGL